MLTNVPLCELRFGLKCALTEEGLELLGFMLPLQIKDLSIVVAESECTKLIRTGKWIMKKHLCARVLS